MILLDIKSVVDKQTSYGRLSTRLGLLKEVLLDYYFLVLDGQEK